MHKLKKDEHFRLLVSSSHRSFRARTRSIALPSYPLFLCRLHRPKCLGGSGSRRMQRDSPQLQSHETIDPTFMSDQAHLGPPPQLRWTSPIDRSQYYSSIAGDAIDSWAGRVLAIPRKARTSWPQMPLYLAVQHLQAGTYVPDPRSSAFNQRSIQRNQAML